MITVRKLKIVCKDKEFYDFFKWEQREQNKALNIAIGLIHSSTVLRSIDSGAEAQLKKSIEKLTQNIEKLGKELEKEKITDKKKEQLLKAINTNKELIASKEKELKAGEEFRCGIDKKFNELYMNKTTLYHVLDSICDFKYKRTIELVRQKVKQDYSNSFTDIVTGKVSLQNYKSTFPLMIDGSCISILKEVDELDIVNGYKIKIMLGYELDIILGKRENENSLELQKTLEKCITGDYKICASSIQRDKNNNVIFNLTLDIPIEKDYKPVKGRVCGVDLGIKYPAYMCLNEDTYKKEAVGSINNFLRIRKQMQERRKKLQKELLLTNGGKGRTKKTQALEKLRENEKNFAKTYNHAISKRIVGFARKNKCEYINLEKLTKDGFGDSILRNWSYFELQKMIEYKAKSKGIEVRYIDPCFTSQKCSKCGYVDKENRETQEDFICKKCGFKLNADHNASINIARSKEFIK